MLILITNRKPHNPFQMIRKLSTLDDVERPLRTLLCQSCGIVAKMYVLGVVDGTVE